jgi:hypothetical protein
LVFVLLSFAFSTATVDGQLEQTGETAVTASLVHCDDGIVEVVDVDRSG